MHWVSLHILQGCQNQVSGWNLAVHKRNQNQNNHNDNTRVGVTGWGRLSTENCAKRPQI